MSTKSNVTAHTLQHIEKITGSKLTLGTLLSVIREAEGVSQAQFGAQLNMSRQHLCDVEHGRKFVSPKLAARYAEILGYSKEQFIRLALQDIIDRDELNVDIEVLSKAHQKKRTHSKAAA